MKQKNIFVLVGMFITFFINSLSAQEINEYKLKASDGGFEDWFGVSVAISGDYAIIGAIKGDGDQPNSGAAYVFERASTGWVEKTKLVGSDLKTGDNFGHAVLLDGDYAVVGARERAYIFKREMDSWIEIDKLIDYANVGVGRPIAISGDHIVFIKADSLFFFKNELDDWTQVQSLPLDYSPSSVAIDGDNILVGTSSDDEFISGGGAAYFYTKQGEGWVESQKIHASVPIENELFGNSVAISGEYAIIGTLHGNDELGQAYIFQRFENSWEEQTKLEAYNGLPGDHFGTRVSILNDYAIVGTWYIGACDPEQCGSAYVYKRIGAQWELLTELVPEGGTFGEQFGWRVAINNDKAIVGAVGDHVGARASGAAYVFEGLTTIATSIALLGDTVPRHFEIFQNYPNPFNPETTITYHLSKPSFVKLEVYNIRGQVVKRLVDVEQSVGRHSVKWSGDDGTGTVVSSGVYIYRIEAGGLMQAKKMILLR